MARRTVINPDKTFLAPEKNEITITIKTKANETYLDRLKKKGFNTLITRSAGLDHIDLKHAAKIGIRIKSLKRYHIQSTAEHYWNLLFRLMRPLDQIPGHEIAGKTLLLIGKGKVGKLLMRQAKAFGLKVLTYDILDGQTKKDLLALLPVAQIIFICVPLTKNTKNILDIKEFLKTKQKPWVINAARTKILNMDVMEWAIDNNKISGYAIDDKIKHRITRFKKTKQFVDCRQHMGAQTIEAQKKADEEMEMMK